jgi:hypothetical protein
MRWRAALYYNNGNVRIYNFYDLRTANDIANFLKERGEIYRFTIDNL